MMGPASFTSANDLNAGTCRRWLHLEDSIMHMPSQQILARSFAENFLDDVVSLSVSVLLCLACSLEGAVPAAQHCRLPS